MSHLPRRGLAAAAALALFAVGCADAGDDAATVSAAPSAASATADDTSIVVHRSETCGCCGEYEDFLEARGFTVVQEMHEDMTAVKQELGVPASEQSCHTSVIGGYVVEGHVPLLAIRALLDQQPDIDGIALAGMPVGSPGMPGEKAAPFVVTSLVDGEVVGEFGTY